MKATVQVENKAEGQLIALGLAVPQARAFVKIMGALSQLPTQKSKDRVLKFVSEMLTDGEDTDGRQ